MHASRNVALLIGDQKFLRENSQAIKNAYTSWDGSTFNPESILRGIVSGGEGVFAPWTIDNFQVGAINLLPMKTSTGMNMDKDSMAMPGSITVDVSDALAVQSLGNLLSDDAEVGLMIVVTDPSGQDAQSVRIHNATFSLTIQPESRRTIQSRARASMEPPTSLNILTT